jgi:serine protease Do
VKIMTVLHFVLLGVRTRAALAVLALILLSFAAAPVFAEEALSKEVQKDIEVMIRESKARAALVRNVRESVVHISVEKKVSSSEQQVPELFDDPMFRRFFEPRLPNPPREYKQRGLGSGFIINKDGFILTNNHVVEDADKIIVKLFDGREFEGKLVGRDPATDVAVIHIKAEKLSSARLGNSDETEVGESVIAIGNPFGLEQTVTTGIVSAKGRSGVGVTDYEDFIQTDASINPGNSGGPLINLRGEVIGINSAIFSRGGGNIGIGFAIPINMTTVIAKSLMESGKVTRGFLGVVIQDITQDLADVLNVTVGSGVLISNVGPDSPAAKAGVKQGDLVTQVNGKDVKSSNQLRNLVAAIAPGQSVTLKIMREGKPMQVAVLVGEQPPDMRAAFAAPNGGGAAPRSSLGMTVEPLNPATAQQYGYAGLNGLIVTDVQPNTPAALAGLRTGALIIEANRKPVRSPADLQRAVEETGSGKSLLLLVRVSDMSRFLVIKVP